METTYSTLTRLNEEPSKETCPPEKDMWMWISDETIRSITPLDRTTVDDWEALPHNGLVPYPDDNELGALHFFVLLQSQLLPSFLYTNNKSTCFTTPENITRAAKAPVFLGSLQDLPETTMKARHPYPYPPKEHGATALVLGKEQCRYYIEDLPSEAQERQRKISQLIEAFQALPQEETFDVFVDCPEELRTMVQNLAEDYYTYHQEQANKPHARKLAPITSRHITKLPSANEMRALVQSHAPNMLLQQMKLIESDDGSRSEMHLFTPNNAQLRVQGDSDHEQRALQTYVTKEKGVEGLKAMLVCISAYHEQTGGRDRKEDACVKLRDILIRIHNGDDKHADDPDEQRKLMHIILFFARTWVTDMSKPAERSRSKYRQGLREYTPLFVLEGLKADERTGILVPKEVEFHLGKDFHDLMFGRGQKYYTLPTSLILGYHSTHDQHEICLAFYLANMISLNKGSFGIHFPELLLQSGLENKEDINHGAHRTRDALPAIYALERMEREAIIKRDSHDDIDTILAIEHFHQGSTCAAESYDEYQSRLIEKKMQKKLLSPETYYRVTTQYHYLQGKPSTELQKIRLKKLKHLLDTNDKNTIVFHAGAVIHKQVEKYKQQHIVAIERNEKAKIAAMSRSKKQGRRPTNKG